MARPRKPYHQRQQFWRRVEYTALAVMAVAVVALLWALFVA